jgi:hypothetical protein
MNNDGTNIIRVTNTSTDATAISPVWMPMDSTTFIDEVKLFPERFQLYQNYPNPFNPNTEIEYTLAEPSKVGLKIFNIAGRVIKTLVDSYMSNGIHNITWNGKDNFDNSVSPGIYFYQLTCDSFSQTKKMVLIE